MADAYLSEAPSPPHTNPPTHCIRVYSILIHTGKGGRGGGEMNQREGYRGNISQSWVETTNMTDYEYISNL